MLVQVLTGVLAASDIVVARQLIGSQALVRRPAAAQTNAGSFAAISSEKNHALILKSDPDCCQSSFGDAEVPLRFSPLDGHEGQARAPGKLSLR